MAVGAALMLAWVIVSSEGDVEYGAVDQPGNIHLQDWLKQRVPAKATPLHKAENTLAHIASTVKVLRLTTPTVQFEIATAFRPVRGADNVARGHILDEVFRFDGNRFTARPFTRAAALAAYLKYVDMKRTFMNLTEVSVTEGELWSLDFPVPCGDITHLFSGARHTRTHAQILCTAYFAAFIATMFANFITLGVDARREPFQETHALRQWNITSLRLPLLCLKSKC